MQLREQVEWFSFEMEKVLQDNDHKKGLFDDMSLYDLVTRLKEEFEELLEYTEVVLEEDEVHGYIPIEDVTVREEVKKEAIDVANFAMAIAWSVRK